MSFCDSFKALVDKNHNITSVKNFHAKRSFLSVSETELLCIKKKTLSRLLNFFQILTTRDALVFEMCRMISKAYYDIYRISKTDYEWDQNRRIAFVLSIPTSNAPSTDSVIKHFKHVVTDWQ